MVGPLLGCSELIGLRVSIPIVLTCVFQRGYAGEGELCADCSTLCCFS